MFKKRAREAIEIFCRARSLNRNASFEQPAIYKSRINHVTKSPTTLSLDNDPTMESKACQYADHFSILGFETSFALV